MVYNMKKIYKYKLALGLVLLLMGIFEPFQNIFRFSPFILIEMGIIVIIVTVVRHFRLGKQPVNDERTKKLSSYGVAYSWLLTIIAIALLVWVDLLELVVLSARDVLLILFLIMILSVNVFKWYFMRKADVD